MQRSLNRLEDYGLCPFISTAIFAYTGCRPPLNWRIYELSHRTQTVPLTPKPRLGASIIAKACFKLSLNTACMS